MKRNSGKPLNSLFKPQDRYYVNNEGEWWFFTVDQISGPYSNKASCVDACRYYIQKRDGVL
ncbi:MAG: hypothetical protein KAT04_07840 [Methylococcales bacterium]|nr:hypothetical protein [Methylococcales bacterium]